MIDAPSDVLTANLLFGRVMVRKTVFLNSGIVERLLIRSDKNSEEGPSNRNPSSSTTRDTDLHASADNPVMTVDFPNSVNCRGLSR